MPPFINGLAYGLIFILSVGPGFFSLIQTSVQKGFSRAIFLAFGISLSDIAYITLALMGVSSFLESPDVRRWLAIAGTIVLIAYGIYSWFKKPRLYREEVNGRLDKGRLKYLLKGFILNGLNPFILVFWVTIISIISVQHDYDLAHQIYFFAGVLVTILTMDIAKAFLANRIRSRITPRSIMVMNRTVGVILIIFAIRIIFYLIDKNGQIDISIPEV